jgi:CRP-like cAMP-binding protein
VLKQWVDLSVPVLKPLPLPALHDFLKNVRYETYRPGDVVFKQGDHCKELYVVMSGSVDVHVKSARNEYEEVGDLIYATPHKNEVGGAMPYKAKTTTQNEANPDPQSKLTESETTSEMELKEVANALGLLRTKHTRRRLRISHSSDKLAATPNVARDRSDDPEVVVVVLEDAYVQEFGKRVAVKHAGDVFGEQSAITDAKTGRTASIIVTPLAEGCEQEKGGNVTLLNPNPNPNTNTTNSFLIPILKAFLVSLFPTHSNPNPTAEACENAWVEMLVISQALYKRSWRRRQAWWKCW